MAKVQVYIEGGVIHNILADIDVDVDIIDFDTDGLDTQQLAVTYDGNVCYTTHTALNASAELPKTYDIRTAAYLLLGGAAALRNMKLRPGREIPDMYVYDVVQAYKGHHSVMRSLIEKLFDEGYLVYKEVKA
jgi:hypothetical protein